MNTKYGILVVHQRPTLAVRSGDGLTQDVYTRAVVTLAALLPPTNTLLCFYTVLSACLTAQCSLNCRWKVVQL